MARAAADPVERTLSALVIDEATDCWIFLGATDARGYGIAGRGGGSRSTLAHRLIYEAWRGPVPDGLELDHLCRNPLCCNPDHLEPAAAAARTAASRGPEAAACRNGHEYTPENTWRAPDGTRRCLTCRRANWKRANDRRAVSQNRRRLSR